MASLTFYGAVQGVTGSCYLLESDSARILLDCGLIQGSRGDEARNADPFPFDAAKIDAVVLSHAHLDHCGRLPLLVKRGFRGPVYAQEASCELAAILLADAAHLQERDAEYQSRKTGKRVKPLYTFAEGERVVRQMRGVKYRQRFEVVPGIEVRFRDAGHILGSCVVEVWVREGETVKKIVFSGDLGPYDTPILCDPEPMDRADVVLRESTYGGRRHRAREQTIAELGEILTSPASREGNILVPAFSIGRSQEILYQLGKHYEEWDLGRFRIFLDSPMAIEASKVYWEYTHLYDEEATRLRRENGGMPLLPNLALSRTPDESMAINRIHAGAIVIAGSGMCSGGRIKQHLKHNIWRRECHVIISGFQAQGTLGRSLVDGAKYIRLWGETVRVAATIHTVGGLSAHADQTGLKNWYANFEGRPRVVLVHGETTALETLSYTLKDDPGAPVTIAKYGQVLDLIELE